MAYLIKDRGGQSGEGDHSYARMVDPIMVPSHNEEIVVITDEDPQQVPIPPRNKEITPNGSKTSTTSSIVQLERQQDVPLSV